MEERSYYRAKGGAWRQRWGYMIRKIKNHYNAIAVKKDDNEIITFYECDKDKNVECEKTICGDCKYTRNIEYAKELEINVKW